MVAYKTKQKLASICSGKEHIEEATLYLAYIPVVEWLATFNQKSQIEQGKGERSCPLFSGNPPPIIQSAPPATSCSKVKRLFFRYKGFFYSYLTR